MKKINTSFIKLIIIFIIFLQNASAQNCVNTSVGFPPINDLGINYFRNFQGGLYPNGNNSRPLSHNDAGLNLSSQILPLDTSGNYDPVNGKIVLLSVGMSNCSQEFTQFMNEVNNTPNINPKLVLVNGAQGGQDINAILNPNAAFWNIIQQRLTNAGVSIKQVQAVWYKEAEAQASDTTFPNYPIVLKNKFKTTMNIMKTKYKNLKLCYLASRIYAGYATSSLNPEPYAYYSGWSVKWLIEDQINGDTNLVFTGTNAKSAWLSWGPYLWADGTTPRLDGLTWNCPVDYSTDGTHPSIAGRQKVASRLLNFFLTDPTTIPWFLKTFTLNLTLAIEGFLNSQLNTLNMKDTVTCYLRGSTVPYNIVDSAKAVIDSLTLKGIFKFYNITNGLYYIVVKHRNSIETWSKAGGEFITFGSFYSYDFTISSLQAFGNNLVLKGSKYCIYSGDVNQDGVVDVIDLSLVYNDIQYANTGYLNTDVNGDKTVDVIDLSITYNNASNVIIKIIP